jgi:hypothetical protein
MRETCSSGSVRGAFSNERPYRERELVAGLAYKWPDLPPLKSLPRGNRGLSVGWVAGLRQSRRGRLAADLSGYGEPDTV